MKKNHEGKKACNNKRHIKAVVNRHGSGIKSSQRNEHPDTAVSLPTIHFLDIFCSNSSVIDVAVDQLIFGIGREIHDCDFVVDYVIDFPVFTNLCWEVMDRNRTQVGHKFDKSNNVRLMISPRKPTGHESMLTVVI